MSYLEEYVDWLKDENQALYDALAKQEKENKNLKKKIREYEYREELLNEAEMLKRKADYFDLLLAYFDEWRGIIDA